MQYLYSVYVARDGDGNDLYIATYDNMKAARDHAKYINRPKNTELRKSTGISRAHVLMWGQNVLSEFNSQRHSFRNLLTGYAQDGTCEQVKCCVCKTTMCVRQATPPLFPSLGEQECKLHDTTTTEPTEEGDYTCGNACYKKRGD